MITYCITHQKAIKSWSCRIFAEVLQNICGETNDLRSFSDFTLEYTCCREIFPQLCWIDLRSFSDFTLEYSGVRLEYMQKAPAGAGIFPKLGWNVSLFRSYTGIHNAAGVAGVAGGVGFEPTRMCYTLRHFQCRALDQLCDPPVKAPAQVKQ